MKIEYEDHYSQSFLNSVSTAAGNNVLPNLLMCVKLWKLFPLASFRLTYCLLKQRLIIMMVVIGQGRACAIKYDQTSYDRTDQYKRSERVVMAQAKQFQKLRTE